MDDHEWVAERFERHRTHLRGVAYRMLGSLSEADEAVQEAWLRLSRSDASVVKNLGGWLTTMVARVCLDVLRSRKLRCEEPLDQQYVRGTHDPRGRQRPGDRSFARRLGRPRPVGRARSIAPRGAARLVVESDAAVVNKD